MTLPSLDELRFTGLLRPIDLHFAKSMAELAAENNPEITLAAAMVSAKLGEGHVCLDLAGLAGQLVQLPDGSSRQFPALASWRDTLAKSELVSGGSRTAPLVFTEDDRLYLRRYWLHEQFLARAILERARPVPCDAEPGSMQASLERLFGSGRLADDDQRMAALMAARRQFSVVSGGPGTGKTFTVVKILALLIEQAFSEGSDPPRIHLMAPTGKAAARLVESIQRAKVALPCEQEVKDAIPEAASTIHRALGATGSGTRFRYREGNPLVTDLVLVDEASMVNVALMSRLMAALPEGARVILLGDRDQLASVEAGSVLADICNAGAPIARSQELARDVEELTGEIIALPKDAQPLTGICDCVTHLSKSYRYAAGSGIEALALAIHAGDAEAALAVLADASYPDIALQAAEPRAGLSRALAEHSLAGYQELVAAREPAEALAALDRFRILCAHHEGPASAAHINAELRAKLASVPRFSPRAAAGLSYHGQPIIIGVNDYELRLFNGDLGVMLQDEDGLWAHFEGEQGLRKLRPSRLPAHSSVYAMSVHKSQGSEFDDIAIVLPRELSPVLSRELIYTAVTRAKKRLTIYASPSVLGHCIASPTRRASGLRSLLWGARETEATAEVIAPKAAPVAPIIEPVASNKGDVAEKVADKIAETPPAPKVDKVSEKVAEAPPAPKVDKVSAKVTVPTPKAPQPPLLVPPPAQAPTKARPERRQRSRAAKPAPAEQLAFNLDGLPAAPKATKPARQRQALRRAALPTQAASCCGHKSAALLRCPRCAHVWVECCTC